ncbi:MAG: galactose mutarotase [Lachnospiraceae bacterium]|jgi:aldose 1-epimerase|nr:galactose mutarotase [Lachnospiraceae bacterium]
MGISKEDFGETADGRKFYLWSITNAGITLKVTNLGADMVSLSVPGRDGKTADILLGYDKGAGYLANPNFFGATIWPSANRIAGAQLEIDGRLCSLTVNDGKNNLHTDFNTGSHKQLWDAEEVGSDSVRFTLSFPDGRFGLPGNRTMSLVYTLTPEGTVRLTYHGTSDKKTLLNPTNHAYYNLAGEASGNVNAQVMRLFCSAYTPVVAGAIPTGEIASVHGTPLDFTSPKPIGRDIEEDFEQLRLVGGYDHNFVVDGYEKPSDGAKQNAKLNHAAQVYDPVSGRQMDVYTTLPGMQFYSGNSVDIDGKGGVHYGRRQAFCLETQYFPDNVHHEQFEHAFFGAGRDYNSVTEYRYSLCKE